jgi:transposase, IS30 family
VRRRQGDNGRRLTGAERLEIRRLTRSGEPYRVAAAAVGTTVRTVGRLMRATGGLPPRDHARSPLRLSVAEREEISRALLAGTSLRAVARGLGRAPSTISREVARNGGRRRYRAWRAETWASRRARRPKAAKLARSARLRAEVERLLGLHWSPEQIAQRLRREHPDDREMRVSHETIYQSLFVQGRGALRRELHACLRSGRVRRRAQHRTARPGVLTDMVLLSERPAEVEDRAVPGHWEGDLIIGERSHSAIGTLVERQTRYVLLVALPAGRSAPAVRDALAARILTLPEQLRRTLTWDRGHEMAEHVRFTVDTGVQVYFCDPHSPWQRGSNENTNGLLRQYFPKGTDLSVHSQADLDAVARELNGRPRQTLGWMKPSEALAKIVALTD